MVRFKNRYVLVKADSETNIKFTASILSETLKSSVHKFYGDFGIASIGNIQVKWINEKHKLAIVRVSHGSHKFVTSSLPLMNKCGKELAKYRILYVGATIRSTKKHLLTFQDQTVRKIISNLSSDTERREFLEEIKKTLED